MRQMQGLRLQAGRPRAKAKFEASEQSFGNRRLNVFLNSDFDFRISFGPLQFVVPIEFQKYGCDCECDENRSSPAPLSQHNIDRQRSDAELPDDADDYVRAV